MARKKFESKGVVLIVPGYSEQQSANYRDLPDEIWKQNLKLGEEYEVSNLGRIRTVDHPFKWFNGHSMCQYTKKGIIRKGVMTVDGYFRLNAKRKGYFVHRIVASTFLGDSDLFVNHINGNKQDNRICNLEYVTHKENMEHALRTGLWSGKFPENKPKLSDEIVDKIRDDFKNKRFKQKELAGMYNVCKDTIGRICRGKFAYAQKKENK